MSKLIKDLEDGDNEGWYGEFFNIEIYRTEEGEWEQYGDQYDWRAKAEGYAQHVADHENAKVRIVMVRQIEQPIAGAVFEPSGGTPK